MEETIMGAETFFARAKGQTAKEAFKSAKSQAEYDYGHRGYTGTIAEKDEFTSIGKTETLDEARQMADKLIDSADHRINDKWGPAGCIETKDPRDGSAMFLFFGWASS
jgi:hypothetical protein